MTPGRPLQERLALAEVVALVEVVGLEPGRLGLTLRRALRGAPPEAFEVKRGRSDPPPLVVGDRALLLLRGARPPYVLVDDAGETIRIVDDDAERRWGAAVAGALSRLEDPEALAPFMLGWIDEGPTALRDAAFASMLPLVADSEPLRQRIAVDRATAAVDPARSPSARAVSARLTGLHPAGLARLVESLVGGAPLEAGTVSQGLRGGALIDHPRLGELFELAAGSEDAALRGIAVREAAAISLLGEDGLARLREISAHDPDESVRREANETLDRLHRARR